MDAGKMKPTSLANRVCRPDLDVDIVVVEVVAPWRNERCSRLLSSRTVEAGRCTGTRESSSEREVRE
jgi:hypothetical protein